MKVYSPSEVEKYIQCPMLWALGKSGWYPNSFSYGEVTAAIGTGIHAGAHEVHKAIVTYPWVKLSTMKEAATERALEASKADIRRYLDNGCFPELKVEDWEERINDQVPRGVKAYIENYPITEGCIIASEEAFGARRGESDYQGRVDLVLQDETGLYPVDIKTKQPFKSSWYKDVFVNSFQWSFQMYHYSWLLGASKFGLVMIEMKAKPVVTMHMFKVDSNYMKQWFHTATHKWQGMERVELGNEVPDISNNHYAYGRRCPFYRACLEFKLDEQLMQSEYVKLEVS